MPYFNTQKLRDAVNRLSSYGFDDSVEAAKDVLLKAVKTYLKLTSFDVAANDLTRVLSAVEENNSQEKEYDATILFNIDDEASSNIRTQITKYLQDKNVLLLPSPNMAGAREFKDLEEAIGMVRWLILIINQDSILHNTPFKLQTLSILADCVKSKKVRIIPVIHNMTESVNGNQAEGISSDNGNSADGVSSDNGNQAEGISSDNNNSAELVSSDSCNSDESDNSHFSTENGTMTEAGIIPDLFKWLTYIDTRTKGFEHRVYQALRGEDIPLTLDAGHIPAGNIGYGLAWGYVLNYLEFVLSQLGQPLQDLLRDRTKISQCPDKLYLLVPETCNCPGVVDDKHVKHVLSLDSKDDYRGGANILKSLDIYSLADISDESKKHNFIGQYPAPLRTLSLMNECRVAGINLKSMKRELRRFCHTLQDILQSPVGEKLRNKCELVFYDDNDCDDLQRQLSKKLHCHSQLKRKQDVNDSQCSGVKCPRY
ncbi:uncharacterized protein LOC117322110 [Pecten maximus]|uniref:uncharacterized protein LOC117322110 n=1 Tax=Pecten maximus TaxID=6579 RepID=UPI001459179E|nr:uncharacterized protein LOC117322110 [Pecten maximus]